jgi:hypothetical protein
MLRILASVSYVTKTKDTIPIPKNARILLVQVAGVPIANTIQGLQRRLVWSVKLVIGGRTPVMHASTMLQFPGLQTKLLTVRITG